MRVSVHIVAYESMPDILEALRSLEAQTFTDFRVIVVDNASGDDAAATLTASYGSRVAILRNYQNLGFAAAHNQAIALARRGKAEYVLVMNPDVVLEPTTIEQLVTCAGGHPKAGAIAPRLLRPAGETIDSTGLRLRRSFYAFDRGSGKPALGNYLREEEVFGVSGALALYRLAALEDAAMGTDYFDHDFFSYKEDVDLSWRLRLRGFEIWYTPKAQALHQRNVRIADQEGLSRLRANRSARSPAVSRWSYRNQWWVIVKNVSARLLARNAPWLFAREFGKAVYLTVFEFATIRKGSAEAIAGLRRMIQKRRAILGNAKVSSADMQRWLT